MKRIRTFVTGHPRGTAVLVISAVTLGILGFLWFRPDKLLVNSTVDEALPTAAAQPTAGNTAPAGATGPQVLSVGSFRKLEHETTGQAKIIRLADGGRLLRLENFKTSNGPDVIVILSDTPATEDKWSAYDDGKFVAIGPLKGNVGNQNYQLPPGVDLSKYSSVVIWCRRFNVAFGAAPLELKG